VILHLICLIYRPVVAQRFGYTEDKGVVIVKVTSGSPAGWAGLRPGDLIIQVNNEAISDLKGFRTVMSKALQKEKIRLLVKSGKYAHYVIISLR